ncbi:MAG: hypothetical protein H6873_11060 [Hyphomicrobiaceae bacterium]|nr:hypothetical protein [Hyphomicrobiaceae bacterium]
MDEMQVTTQTGTKVDFNSQAASSAPVQIVASAAQKQTEDQKPVEEIKKSLEKPVPAAERNPDVWSVADLVQAQHINALFPHPDSQSAKEIKAHGASRAYVAFNSIKS